MVVTLLALAFAADPDPVSEVVIVESPGRLESQTSAALTVLEVGEAGETQDTADLVGTAAGVTVQRLGGLGDYATVSIRGSSARQVEVLLDGMPLNPDGAGAVDLSELPLQAFERVEVWRGNAPIGLGGTAMGGVVNLVTGTRPVTAFAATMGAWQTARMRAMALRKTRTGDVFVAGQLHNTTGGFRWFDDGGTQFDTTDDAIRRRVNNDQRLGTVQLRIRGGEAVQWTGFSAFMARDEGVPGSTGAPTEQVRFAAVRHLAVVQVAGGGLRLRLHHRVRGETLSDPAGELLAAAFDRQVTHSLGLDGQAVRTLGTSVFAGMISGAWDHHPDGERLVGRANVQVGLQAGPIQLTPTLSSVLIASRGAGSASQPQLLPRLGLLWRLGERVVLKANGGRYHRPPDLLELFGNRGSLAGRADLRPERGLNADLGIRYEGANVSTELGGFFGRSTDLITYVQNAQRIGVPTNIGQALLGGAEGNLSLRGRGLTSRTNLTGLWARNTTDDPAVRGRQLPRVPTFSADQQLGVGNDRFDAGYSFQVQAGAFADAPNLARIPVRPLHGLFLRGRAGDAALELDLRNALNLRQQTVPLNPFQEGGPRGPRAVTDFLGYPLPGRSLWLTVRWQESSR